MVPLKDFEGLVRELMAIDGLVKRRGDDPGRKSM
jgi:hypothetical protein